ncbi:SLC13 family permease, partial [Candidatus Hodarchaeum mangrovi]
MLEDLLESFIPLFLLICVNLAVIFRRIGKLKVPAWTAFMIAALILILLQPGAYERAVIVIGKQVHVLIFLFGMFVLVTALDISGSLEERGKSLLLKGKSPKGLLLLIHFGLGLAASLLVNDTVAIIGPILLIAFTKQVRKYPKPYILAICYALTFGSALLPTGNPQNYILAIAGGISFLEFGIWALFPTFFSLFGSYVLLKYLLKSEF